MVSQVMIHDSRSISISISLEKIKPSPHHTAIVFSDSSQVTGDAVSLLKILPSLVTGFTGDADAVSLLKIFFKARLKASS